MLATLSLIIAPLSGKATWTRPLDGGVVRENWSIDTGRRPLGGELSITRTGPNTYEAVQLNDWTGEPYVMAGTWDPASKQLTFDRVLPTPAPANRAFMRWIYEFAQDGSFMKRLFAGDPKTEMTLQSTYKYSRAR